MILDNTAKFASAQACTTTNGTNVIDLGASGTVLGTTVALSRDVGPGEPIPFRPDRRTIPEWRCNRRVEITSSRSPSYRESRSLKPCQVFLESPPYRPHKRCLQRELRWKIMPPRRAPR